MRCLRRNLRDGALSWHWGRADTLGPRPIRARDQLHVPEPGEARRRCIMPARVLVKLTLRGRSRLAAWLVVFRPSGEPRDLRSVLVTGLVDADRFSEAGSVPGSGTTPASNGIAAARHTGAQCFAVCSG